MKKYLKLFVCILGCAIFSSLSLYAKDFGLVLDQSGGYSLSGYNSFVGNAGALDYSGALTPWFSTLVGERGVYISASAKADWENSVMTVIPELLRTDFSWSFDNGEFKLGRMYYTDPLGFIATGLFDGANVSLDVGGGSVSFGAWYTGLLYKERANITMTQMEQRSYGALMDYSNFADTYFAPRRVLSAFGWEHQGLAEHIRVKLALLGQFDLAGENSLHSQYLEGKVSVPVNLFVFDLGGCLELIEFADEKKIALAGVMGISCMFSAARLSLSGRYSSGVIQDSLTAFLPLTNVYQGDILQAKLSGLSVVSLDYLGRLRRTLSAGLAASCFIRSDLGTYAYPFSAVTRDGYIVGTEFFGHLWWNPVSDIQLNFGGGAFLPSLGNMAPDAFPSLRAEIGLILTLY